MEVRTHAWSKGDGLRRARCALAVPSPPLPPSALPPPPPTKALRSNAVPAAGALYLEDMYVDYALAQETVQLVRGVCVCKGGVQVGRRCA